MQTSTPLASTSRGKSREEDFHRTAMLQDMANSTVLESTPRPGKKEQSHRVNQSPTILPDHNDELERQQRRKEAELHGRLSRLSIITTPKSPQVFEEKEIRNHFQICYKMFTENKISAKNVWNLNIIDYMRTILNSKGLSKDSLQVASTSLDISAKIYGIRVDDIHAESLKLASNIGCFGAKMQLEAEGAGDGDEGGDSDKENEDTSKKKKRKRHVFSGKKTTVVKDPQTLLADVPKLESVFFQTQLNLESSCIDNLFTNKLPMNHARYKFMFLSKEKWWSCDNLDPNVISDKMYPFKIKDEKAEPIRPAFAGFEIDEWDPAQEESLLRAPIETDKPIMNEEVAFDAKGIPIPELDGSVHDIFAAAGGNDHHYGSSDEEAHGVEDNAVMTKQVTHIVDFKPQENSAGASDYSYVNCKTFNGNKLITQAWAGPSHWKFKHIQRATCTFSGQQKNKTGKLVRKTRIQPTLIDFNSEHVPVDKSKMYKVKRYCIDQAPFQCTLPEVFQFTDAFILRPNVFISPNEIKKFTTDVEARDVQPYNYENPNDSHYCAVNNRDDNEPDGDDGGDGDAELHNEEPGMPEQNFLGGNLVNAPETVPETRMHYAMKAKKMDMKKLKTAVWKSLVCDKPNDIVPDEDMYEREVPRRQFSDIYKQLPNRITDKMQQELSPALAFVSLLHLTNEHNLKLTAHDNRRDITIEQTKDFVP